jgi:hypothetical protein
MIKYKACNLVHKKLIFFFFCFSLLGIEPRTSHMVGKGSNAKLVLKHVKSIGESIKMTQYIVGK